MSDQPNYTRIPNFILEAMPTLGNAELRVLLAIARKTVGYQKECDRISVSQIADMTGLTSRNTQQAITELLKKEYIGREPAGKQTYCYTLKTISPRDTDQNHIPSDTISLGDTEPYPLGTQLEVKPYPLGITQKKESKEKRKRESAGAKSATRKHREPTPEVVVLALADECKIDRAIAPKIDRDQLYQSAGILARAGAKHGQTPEQIVEAIHYVAGYFRTNDWRGRKGNTPTPSIIRQVWREAIDARTASANGHRNGRPIRQNTRQNPEWQEWTSADLDAGL